MGTRALALAPPRELRAQAEGKLDLVPAEERAREPAEEKGDRDVHPGIGRSKKLAGAQLL